MQKLGEHPMGFYNGKNEIQRYDPKLGAMDIHVAEAAEKAAKRVKDKAAFEAAMDRKMGAQRDFAAHYRATFTPSQETGGRAPVLAPGTPGEYCQQYGFALRTVQRWCERLLDDAAFEVERYKRLAKIWSLVEMEQAANFSSESNEWYTPARYLDAVRDCLGQIDLDPASSKKANEVVKAKRIFTIADNALNKKWFGRVFLNPPYGTEKGESVAGMFCRKAIDEYRVGNVKEGIILVNSVHSQSWQRPLYSFPVCFVDHRIQFVSGDGEENKNPTFSNLFIYLGNDKKKFAEHFESIGYCMESINDKT